MARNRADKFSSAEKPRFVTGVLGANQHTASMSVDVNDPGARAITFDALLEDYALAMRALIDGGADIIMLETVFDTVNAKAAVFAVLSVFDEVVLPQGKPALPIMLSATITDLSGRTSTD